MAKGGRPNKYNWKEIKKHYEAGLSQSEIVKIFQCPKSSLSEKIKTEMWIVNEQAKAYISDNITLSEQKHELYEQDEHLALISDKIVEEKTKHLKLINDNATKLANKLHTMADEIDTPTDLKTLVEANDRLAITLKVADRHAPKIEVNTQNNNNAVVGIKRVTIARKSDRD